ncbi:hypothetical protein D3C72_1399200 [compost metagenome]
MSVNDPFSFFAGRFTVDLESNLSIVLRLKTNLRLQWPVAERQWLNPSHIADSKSAFVMLRLSNGVH